MTLRQLKHHWQDYAIDIDVVAEGQRIRAFLILRTRFFTCFLDTDKEGLVFDPGGHNPRCFTYKCDKDGKCYLKMPEGQWRLIGKFVKIDKNGDPIE
jgi:hypothetical protein